MTQVSALPIGAGSWLMCAGSVSAVAFGLQRLCSRLLTYIGSMNRSRLSQFLLTLKEMSCAMASCQWWSYCASASLPYHFFLSRLRAATLLKQFVSFLNQSLQNTGSL